MYRILNVPKKYQWLKNKHDWVLLKEEIMKEYYQSKEYKIYINSFQQNDIMYQIAMNYKNMVINKHLK